MKTSNPKDTEKDDGTKEGSNGRCFNSPQPPLYKKEGEAIHSKFQRDYSLNNRSMVLIVSLMLIAFAAITILSVTIFIVERHQLIDARSVNNRSIENALAGIHQAIYNFRFRDLTANGYFSLGQLDIDANNYFVLGANAADLLMVNTSLAAFSLNGKDLGSLTTQNAANSQSITIDRMIVSWNTAPRLTRIRINNQTVWTGNLNSPANADITNFTLNTTPTIYDIDQLRFSGDMSGVAAITVQFVMTDGSNRSVTVYPASNNYIFTAKSTGKTIGSGIYRTIQADYNALTGRITDYHEINTEITP